MRITRLLKGFPILLLCVTFTQLAFSQTKTISGTVTDAAGTVLQGVTVVVKGSQTGTTTDISGAFSLNVSSSAKTLIFSSVGYVDQEVDIADKTTVQVSLAASANQLSDVVVVGYGTARRKDITGAVASVSAKDFNSGVVTNPLQQIQGKVAGLVVTQPGGDPNQSMSIRLRGQTSLTGGQTPLVVVNGVPLDDPNQIANIPPGDIESFDVLKDASATAIYGSRGANGVIIINTKKGHSGRSQVDYNGYVGIDKVAKKWDLLDKDQFLAAIPDSSRAVYDKGGNTDWLDAITRTAFTQSHNIGISGGSDKFNYRGSVNYINQEGVVINTGKEEIGLRFDATQKALNDKLEISAGIVNTQVNRKQTDYGIFTYVFSTPPTYPVYNPDGSYYGFFDFEQQNPVSQQNMELNTGKEHFTQVYGTANYEIIKGLKLGTTGSLVYFNNHKNYFQPVLPGVGNLNSGNQYSEDRNSSHGDIHVNYLHDFGLHNISFTGVYEYNVYNYNNFQALGSDFLLEQDQDNNLGLGNSAKNGIKSYRDESQLISFLARIAYNYNSKYYVTASIRRDGSSKFGTNNPWGNFPSVSAAWRISQEEFMKNVSWVNELKISAGYGVTGNQDAISPYGTLLTLGSVGHYYNPANSSFLYPTAYAPNQNANQDLKWEERHGKNLGLDFALFNNRLSGNFNVYNDKTKNLLYDYTVPVPPYFVSTILANVGDMTNKGVELQLSGDIIRSENFRWNAGGQIGFSNTKVTSLSGSYQGHNLTTDDIPVGYAQGRGLSSTAITYLKIGYSPDVFWLPHFSGVNANGEQLFDNGKGGTVTQGDITDSMKHYIDPAPDYSYGFNSTFTYKQWALNFFLRGVVGQKIYDNTRMSIDNVTRLPGNNVTEEALTNGITDAQVQSDRWLENASYLRLDNLTLSYTFSKIKMLNNLRLYLTATNVFVITKYKGLDPEIRVTNDANNNSAVTNMAYIDANYGSDGYYPRTRSFVFGVNVSFK